MGINLRIKNPRPPVVCLIANYGAPYAGSFIASVRVLHEKYERSGGVLNLVLPSRARTKAWVKTLQDFGMRIDFISEKRNGRSFISIIKLLWRNQAEIVHTHHTRYDIEAAAAAKIVGLLRFRPIRVIWHIRSDFIVRGTILRRIKDFIKYRILGKSVQIILVSDHLKSRPIAGGFDRAKIDVIHNGIDFRRLDAPGDPSKRVERNDFKKESTVLMFGWHPQIKGVDVALRAFDAIAQENIDLSLLLVGGDATRLELTKKYPSGYPSWLCLAPPIENVANYLRQVAIFLSASRGEGFSFSVYEAMACGCLVIASDIPAFSWIKNSVRCRWFINEDPYDLARCLREVKALPEDERREISGENMSYIRSKLSVDNWADDIVAIYGRSAKHPQIKSV